MWWVVETSSEKLLVSFPDQASCMIDSGQQWLEVPEGLVGGNVKVLNTDGVLSLIEMTEKSNTNPYWQMLRYARDHSLSVCDWTQLTDSPLDANGKAAWASYRQDLRDLPADTANPESVTWPTQP